MGSLVEALAFPFAGLLGLDFASQERKDKRRSEAADRAAGPTTSLDRQATQADSASRQRLAARRRGSGRQTVLSLGGSFDRENVSRPLLGGAA